MPSLEFFVVANSISVDQRSNRLSVFEILEDLEPVRFAARIPRLCALTVWVLAPEDQGNDFQATLRVRSPGLDEVREFRQNFMADGATQRMLFQLLNVPVLAAGTLVFEMLLNGDRQASHQVRVAAADAATVDDGFLIYGQEEQPAQPDHED